MSYVLLPKAEAANATCYGWVLPVCGGELKGVMVAVVGRPKSSLMLALTLNGSVGLLLLELLGEALAAAGGVPGSDMDVGRAWVDLTVPSITDGMVSVPAGPTPGEEMDAGRLRAVPDFDGVMAAGMVLTGASPSAVFDLPLGSLLKSDGKSGRMSTPSSSPAL